jgi:hypothetical protein
MYLDIVYIYVHSKSFVSRKAKTSYNLERIEYLDVTFNFVSLDGIVSHRFILCVICNMHNVL